MVNLLKYHMVFNGISNLLDPTINVKSIADLSIAREKTDLKPSPTEDYLLSQEVNISAIASHDRIALQGGHTHLAYILQSSLHNKVGFEAYVDQSNLASLQVSGRILFGGDEHVLHVSTLADGQLLGSPDPHYKQGAVALQVSGGIGFFEQATGIITTNFLVSELGDYRDVHTATIFLPSKAEDSIAEENRLLVRDVLDEKAFPVMVDASMEYVADLLALTNASELMVIDGDGNFIGVVSEVDLLQSLIPDIDEIIRVGATIKDALNIFIRNGRDLAGQRITRLVQSNPRTVSPDDELLAVATVMLQSGSRRLAVVEHGKFVGSISLSDLCWAVLSKWNGIQQN